MMHSLSKIRLRDQSSNKRTDTLVRFPENVLFRAVLQYQQSIQYKPDYAKEGYWYAPEAPKLAEINIGTTHRRIDVTEAGIT